MNALLTTFNNQQVENHACIIQSLNLHVYNYEEMLRIKNSNIKNSRLSAETFNFSTKLSTIVENLVLRSEMLLKVSLVS